MSEKIEFKEFAVCDTCGQQTLCRETGPDDHECGGCYWAPITAAANKAVRDERDAAQSELAALREELAILKHPMNSAAILRKELTAAEQRNAELQKDKDRLDALEANFWDVRHNSHPIADTGDSSSSLEIVGHWMDKPFERVIGENYNEDLRAAIDQAMTAPAYPPERPEYPEFDELAQPTESGASE